MKKNYHLISFLCLILLFQLTTNAQTEKVDHLQKEIEQHNEQDSTMIGLLHTYMFELHTTDVKKADSILQISEKLAAALNYYTETAEISYVKGNIKKQTGQYKKAINYYSQSLKQYKKQEKKDSIALCYYDIAVVNYYDHDYNAAIQNFENALTHYSLIENKNKMASSYNGLAISYSETGNTEKMFAHYNKALSLFEETNNQKGIMQCYNNLGVAYYDKGNYPLAMDNYTKALNIAKKINSTTAFKALNNVGLIHKHTENYDKALNYYNEALQIAKRLNEKSNVAQCLNNIGVIYLKKGDYDTAEKKYLEGLAIADSIADLQSTSLCYNNLGNLNLKKKEYRLALKYYKKALVLKKEVNHLFGICHSNIGIATVYVETKQYSKALLFAKEAQLIAQSNHYLSEESEVYNLMFQIYEGTQHYKEALFNLKKHKTFSDSLLNKKSIQKITQLEYDYKYQTQLKLASLREEKLTKKINLSSQDLKKAEQNFLIFVIFFLLSLIILGGVIFYLKFRNISSTTQNIIIEQKLLRSQMTSHFIFNSLSVLQGMILSKEEKKSVSYLSKFSKLLRIILENSRDKIVSLSEEIKAIDNYLVLQDLGTRFPYNYSISVAENIDTKKYKIPPMLIQPFVENAIEHAFGNMQENKKIAINITFENQKLLCTITDNGIGIEAHQKHNKKKYKHSLATTITSERIAMLSKDFKMKGCISIVDRKITSEQGTLVTMVIPYKRSEL